MRGILVCQGTDNLDWSYIEKHLTMFSNLKEETEILDRLMALREEVKATEA